MDLTQACVNCGIAIRERIRRHEISSLPPDLTNILTEWLTSEISPHNCVCGTCYDILARCLATNSRERQLGHVSVCHGCGRSVARTRRHIISELSPLALVVSSWHPNIVRATNYLCHGCYMRANREVARGNTLDAIRLHNTNIHQVPQSTPLVSSEPSIRSVQDVPPPPPLPPGPSIRSVQDIPPPPPLPPGPSLSVQDVSIIVLPNYKRCANTSRRCIFDGCQQNAGHLVPTVVKSNLLYSNKLFVPRSARVCEGHLNSNEWELLLDNTSLINTFTAEQIESLLDKKSEENVIDFENIESMPNHVCHYWTGRTTQEFMELYNSVPIQSTISNNSKSALAMLLIKYRTGDSDARISSLFKIPKSTLQHRMKLVRNCLTEHFVPLHLGVSHISRQQIAERNTIIPEKLFGNPQSNISDRWAIVQCDGTYLGIQKSSNYKYQKMTYSLHKYHNLTKPFMVVCCDGHIVDVFGPFAATQTDAEIMNFLVSSNGSLHQYFRRNDVFILDRGFRDSVTNLEALGFRVHKPETRDQGERQLTTLQANKSRCVTLCRWVVEIINGRFKRDYKLFRNTFFNLASAHMMADYKIAAALINRFHKVVENPVNAEEIAEIATSRLNVPNYLGLFIQTNNLNRRRVLFRNIDASLPALNSFPQLSINELKLISLGPYQVQQARSYYGEHIRDRGFYEIEISPELEFSEEVVMHIGGNHPVLLRGRIKSRHTSRREYYTYIVYDEQPSRPDQPKDAILGYWCNCVAGNRTVGCCAHIMTILWYLGFARYQDSIIPPALFLDTVLLSLND